MPRTGKFGISERNVNVGANRSNAGWSALLNAAPRRQQCAGPTGCAARGRATSYVVRRRVARDVFARAARLASASNLGSRLIGDLPNESPSRLVRCRLFVPARLFSCRPRFWLLLAARRVGNGQETAEEAGVSGGESHLRFHLHLPVDRCAQCGVHCLLDRGLVRSVHQSHHFHLRGVIGK